MQFEFFKFFEFKRIFGPNTRNVMSTHDLNCIYTSTIDQTQLVKTFFADNKHKT